MSQPKSSESFPPVSLKSGKGSGINEVLIDADDLPPLTPAQLAQLDKLSKMSDDDIDFSDIPPLTDEQWSRAVRGKFYRPRKQSVTVRLDADVVDWLQADGKGYQSRMNAILRREMLAARTKAAE